MTENHEEFVSLAILQMEVAQLAKDVSAQTEATKALVDAWNAAGGMVKFVKWVSTFIAACGIIWAVVTHWRP